MEKSKTNPATKTPLPRPAQLKGLHYTQTRNNIAIAIVLAAIAATGVHFRNASRREDYARFYAHFDGQAAFERMARAGLMHSAPQND